MQEVPNMISVKDLYLIKDVLSSMLTISKKVEYYGEMVVVPQISDLFDTVKEKLDKSYKTLLEVLCNE